MTFKKAQREQGKIRLAIDGPAGSGKTYSALLIAQGLADGGKIGMIDSERGSGELYSDLCDYEIAHIGPPYTPRRYVDLIKEATFDVLIVDSASHAWDGEGGVLEMQTDATLTTAGGNSYFAWKEVTPEHNRLVQALLGYDGHVVVTLRTKTAYEISENNKPIRIGLAPIQRAGMEYEFTIVLDIEPEKHLAAASKDRTGLFDSGGSFIPTVETGKRILNWLRTGVDPLEKRRIRARDFMSEHGQVETITNLLGKDVWDWNESDLDQAADAMKAYLENIKTE